jgi:protocatechuate 3,4-dioxygenase beta subunit
MSKPSRRDMVGLIAGAALTPLLGCGSEDAEPPEDGPETCRTIPEETAGPFPGDGTNGANALALDGIVRSDVRSSLGSAGVAQGVPLTVTLSIVDATCQPLAGRAVYIWQCDRDGNYSMYSPATENENYLRGVQVTDEAGRVTFTTIVPGCYPGRWPHIHFEVFASLAEATSGTNEIATSQLAIPKATCQAAYAASGYEASARELAGVSLASDGVFGDDGGALQLAAVTGSVAAGFAAQLVVAVRT